MRHVLFIVCFSLGVSLMILSGYLPQAASAGGNIKSAVTASGNEAEPALHTPEFAGTVTRVVPAVDSPASSGPPATARQHDAGRPDAAHPAAPSPILSPAAPRVVPAEAPQPGEPQQLPAEEASAGGSDPPAEAADQQQPSEPPLAANAGPDRVIWAGWDELVLDGSASVGQKLTYHWRQTGGARTLSIDAPERVTTVARGLLDRTQPSWRSTTYRFELTVTDVEGRQAKDVVEYVAKMAPALRVRPTAERRFELRDGYWLGHFTAWATNLETYESVFEVLSDRELTLTKVGGGAYTMAGGKAEGGYTYQVTVYAQGGEPSSWVEFLVDTDEKIPGILQLGVNWENR